MFIDFRKVFDLADHEILLEKLSSYKLSNSSLKWLNSYHESRQQTVLSGQGICPFAYINSGVQQGSILGPTSFLLSVNDLPLLLKYCYADLFADDATIHINSPNIKKYNEDMLIDSHTIVYWSKLPINFNKNTYLILGSKRRLRDKY